MLTRLSPDGVPVGLASQEFELGNLELLEVRSSMCFAVQVALVEKLAVVAAAAGAGRMMAGPEQQLVVEDSVEAEESCIAVQDL